MPTCPANHPSETSDYCSVCGIAIAGGPAETVPAAPMTVPAPRSAPTGEKCPDCETPRETPTQVFCEVCGYNFRTRTTGIPPVPGTLAAAAAELPRPPVPLPAAAIPAPIAAPAPKAPTAVRWDLIVTVDAALYGTPNPDAPTGQPPQNFTLFENETLIGRGGHDIRVQVPIRTDSGVSRRQAQLTRRPDGTLVVRDLGSANGTQLNGVDLVPGVETPVKDGDVLAMGAWTKLTLRAVSS